MGATTSTDIANLALSHLNVGYEVANLATEGSQEANACRRFYQLARQDALRAFAWPFATSIVSLALVAQQPNNEWTFSYRYPADCLMFRRILSGLRTDNRQSRVPYRIAADSAGGLVFTDMTNAQGEYTVDVSNEAFFAPDFILALSYLLAHLIAPRLTAGDPFKLGDKAMQNYVLTIRQAQANSVNEEQPDLPVESEFVRSRSSSADAVTGALPWSAFPGSDLIK